jgi:cobalt-zinc-cadmium efflux system outer membrane protein
VTAQVPITLAESLSRAVANDPAASATAARLAAAGASVRQAEIGPRPVLGLEFEDFAGTGPFSPFGRSQTTAYYEKTWERGGKREARIEVAQAGIAVARHRGLVRLLDLLAKVQAAWIEAASAEAAIAIAEERVAIAEKLHAEVSRRVARALDPVFAAERASAASAQARIARDQAVESARLARAALAAWWRTQSEFRLDGAAFQQLERAAFEADGNPDLALLAAERDVAAAGVHLAQSQSVADPTFRLGLRHFGQSNELALVAGGSIPLGVEGASRAGIDRAQSEARALDAEIALLRGEIRREADRLVAERARIAGEIARIEAEVLPVTERAAALVVDGYIRGGTAFTYLEMADAQRAVMDARGRRLELLKQFHQGGARLDRLSGRHASLIPQETTP